KILSLFQKTELFQYKFFAWSTLGLLRSTKLEEILIDFFSAKTFEELAKPIAVVATDLVKGKAVAFSKGELFRPLLASMALPIFFTPVEINGSSHADGSIINNVPVEPLIDQCDFIIASHVSPLAQTTQPNIESSPWSLLWRSFELTFYETSAKRLQMCDFIFEPDELSQLNIMDTSAVELAYEIGYQNAKKHIQTFLDRLERKRQTEGKSAS
ncbi:MAG: patatin-like phospholipase family protein, partial [Bacteroidota bacterium]